MTLSYYEWMQHTWQKKKHPLLPHSHTSKKGMEEVLAIVGINLGLTRKLKVCSPSEDLLKKPNVSQSSQRQNNMSLFHMEQSYHHSEDLLFILTYLVDKVFQRFSSKR